MGGSIILPNRRAKEEWEGKANDAQGARWCMMFCPAERAGVVLM